MLNKVWHKFLGIFFHIGDYVEPGYSIPNLSNYILKIFPRLSIHICRSDVHLHSHVWDFHSLILWGGYIEESVDTKVGAEITKKKFLPGQINFKRYDQYHRLTQINGPTYTLFFKSKRKAKHIYFWKDSQKVGSLTYYRKWCGMSKQDISDHMAQIGADPTMVPSKARAKYQRQVKWSTIIPEERVYQANNDKLRRRA